MAGSGMGLLSSLTQSLRNVAWPSKCPAVASHVKEEQEKPTDEPIELLQQTKKPRLATERDEEAQDLATERDVEAQDHHATAGAFLDLSPHLHAPDPDKEKAQQQFCRDDDIQQQPDVSPHLQHKQHKLQLVLGDESLEQDQEQHLSISTAPLGDGTATPSSDESPDNVVTPRQTGLQLEGDGGEGSFEHGGLAGTLSLLEAQALERYLGWHEVQNCRPYQEDRTSFVLADGMMILGLFDGHAGQDTSSYLQEYLVQMVCQKLQQGLAGPEALQHSFMSINSHLRRLQSSFYSGSTATVVLVDGSRIICANTGDSPAFIVSKSGQPTCLTIDHNPNTNDNERRRIQAAGGRIEKMHWGERYMRVLSYDAMSGLAMSRAFGDFNFIGVICDPHICCTEAEEESAYLIVASDGLTEQWSIQGAAEAVCEFALAGQCPREIATNLSLRAIEKGSRDNISVVVLDLQKYIAAHIRA